MLPKTMKSTELKRQELGKITCDLFRIVLAWLVLMQPVMAQELPAGMNASAGVTVDVSSTPDILIINAPDHATIDWDSFSIGANQSVRFMLPNETSSILNRVLGGGASDIWGALYSNGIVFLVNTSGINFHANAQIDTASLIASTLDISKENFQAGNYDFQKVLGSEIGKILNEANISTKNIVFLAEQIQNKGILEANLGHVVLGSGSKQTLSFDNQGLINLVVNEGSADASIFNEGTLRANGGKVMLSAKDINTTLDNLVNNTGVIEATRMEEHDGVVEFVSNGAIGNTGTINTNKFNEKAYTFRSLGALRGGTANFDNFDGAAEIGGSIGSSIYDTGNLIVTSNITLTDSVTLGADVDTDGDCSEGGDACDGSGIFYMQAGTSITGAYNLTIVSSNSAFAEIPSVGSALTSQDSPQLGAISVANLTLSGTGSGNSDYIPSYFATGAIITIGNFGLGPVANIIFGGGSSLSVGGMLSNEGTISLSGNESIILSNGNDTNSGTWNYYGGGSIIKDFGATDYYSLVLNNATYVAGEALAVNGNFKVDLGSTYNASGYQTTVTGSTTVTGGGTYNAGSGNQNLNGGLSILATSGENGVDSTSGLAGVNATYTAGMGITTTTNLTVSAGSGGNGGTTTSANGGAGGNGGSAILSAGIEKVRVSGNVNLAAADSGSTGSSYGGYDLGAGGSVGSMILTGTLLMNGSGIQAVTSHSNSFDSLKYSGSGTLRLQDALDVNGDFTVSSGTFNMNSKNQAYQNGVNWAGAALINTSAASLTFRGSGTQSFDSLGNSFANVTHSGAGTLQLTGNNLNVTGAFTNSNGTYDANGFQTTVGGLTTVSGGAYLAGSANQNFNGGLNIAGENGLNGGNGNDGDCSSGCINGSDGAGYSGSTRVSAVYTAGSGMTTVTGNLNVSSGSGGNGGSGGNATGSASGGSGGAAENGGSAILNSGSGKVRVSGNVTLSSGSNGSNGSNGSDNNISAYGGSGAAGGIAGIVSNTGTLILNGSATQDVTSNANRFDGLTYSGSGTLKLIDQLHVSGDFNLSSGNFDASNASQFYSGNVAINSGAILSNTGAAFFEKSSGTQTFNSGGKTFSQIGHNAGGILQLVGNNLNVTGSFTNSNGTYTANGFQTTVAGLTTVSGGTYTAGSANQNLNGGLSLIAGNGASGAIGNNADCSSGCANGSDGSDGTSGSNATFTAGSGITAIVGNLILTAGNGGTGGDGGNGIDDGIGGYANGGNGGIGGNGGNATLNAGSEKVRISGNVTLSAASDGFGGMGGTSNGNGIGGTNGAGGVAGVTSMSGTLVLNGSGTQDVTSNSNSFDSLTYSGSGTLKLWNALDVNGNFTVSSGAFNANSQGQNYAGNFTLGSGVTYSNQGSVIFDGSGIQLLNSGGVSLIALNHTGSGTLQLSGNNLNVTGSFTNSNGTYAANGFQTTVGGLTTVSGGTYTAGSANQNLNGGLMITGGNGAAGLMGGDATCDGGGNCSPGNAGAEGAAGSTAIFNTGSGITTVVGNLTLNGGNGGNGGDGGVAAADNFSNSEGGLGGNGGAGGQAVLNAGFGKVRVSGNVTMQPGSNGIDGNLGSESGDFGAGVGSAGGLGSGSAAGGVTNTGTLILNGSGTQSINSNGHSFEGLTHSGIGALSAADALDVNGNFLLSGGSVTGSGVKSFAGNVTLSEGTSFQRGTVYFDGSGSATYIDNTVSKQNLGGVIINKNGTLNLGSDMKADSINVSGGTLDLGSGGYTLSLMGQSSGLSALTGNVNTGTNSTVRYFATNSTGNINIDFLAYNNLRLSGPETYVSGSLTGAKAITGSLTIDSGATLALRPSSTDYDLTILGDFSNSGTLDAAGAASIITVSGNWTNSGVFNRGVSTVLLNGVNQTISGNTTFYNLTKTDTANDATSRTLTLAAGTTQTITHTLTLNGLDADDRIILNGSASFDFTGASTLNTNNLISIQGNTILDHSTGISALPLNLMNSINLGGTTGWFTPAAVVPETNTNTATANQIIIGEKEIQNAFHPIINGGSNTVSGTSFSNSDFSGPNLNVSSGNSEHQSSSEVGSGESTAAGDENKFTIVNSNAPIYVSKVFFEIRHGDLQEAQGMQVSGDTIELI